MHLLCFNLIVNVHPLLVFLLLILFRIICWERLSRQLFTVLILNAVLTVLVPLPFGVWWGGGCGTRLYLLLIIAFLSTFHSQPNLRAVAVSVPDHCLSFYLKSGPGMGRRKRSPSAEGTRREEHEREVYPSRKGGSGKS